MERYIVFTMRDKEARYYPIGEVQVKAGDRLTLIDIYTKADNKTLFRTKRAISLIRVAIKSQNQTKTIKNILSATVVDLDAISGEIEYMTAYWRDNFIPDTIDGKVDTIDGNLDMEQCLLALAGQSPRDFNDDFGREQETDGELNGMETSGGFNDLGQEQ